MSKNTISIDLSWLVLLFIVLKLTHVIHLSWWWLALPLGLVVATLVVALLGLSVAALALSVDSLGLKSGKYTITRKGK